ncbi:hypothetical protein NXS10_01060 [Streptococcus sp. SQ9-PEA]|uniref:Tyr recombinase domain-containing protein n=1 Tax=Streptococcus sciuri TaxID=2973939 RepID=A0ABT2F522_9STRE|nr:hypothetical protein [Streptococcus sciuri]
MLAFFDCLSRRRNPNYYDLAIVLLFSGLRIGEVAFTEADFNPETGVVRIDKALQYHDLKVEEFHFSDLKHWSYQYSKAINDIIEKNIDEKRIVMSLDYFRQTIGVKQTYTPRHITANILPKLKKDILKYYKDFDIICIRESKQKVIGYEFVW